MPKDDREVFDHFRSNEHTPVENDFLAYALFAFEKSEWMNHFEGQNGSPPGQTDIDQWISNISDYQLASMRQKAIDLFDKAARDYMKDEVDGAYERAVNSTIVTEVRAASVWWKQLAMALLTAIVAPLAAAHVSGLVALLIARDPSLSPDAVRKLLTETAEKGDGARSVEDFGSGLVDGYRALQAAEPKPAGATSSSATPDT